MITDSAMLSSFYMLSSYPNTTIMPVDVLSEDVRSNLHHRYPEVTEVHMVKYLSYSGICYSKGMLIVHGSDDGLPMRFNEVIQMCIVKEKLCFLVRGVCAWYRVCLTY